MSTGSTGRLAILEEFTGCSSMNFEIQKIDFVKAYPKYLFRLLAFGLTFPAVARIITDYLVFEEGVVKQLCDQSKRAAYDTAFLFRFPSERLLQILPFLHAL
jgi:hypothetical protein